MALVTVRCDDCSTRGVFAQHLPSPASDVLWGSVLKTDDHEFQSVVVKQCVVAFIARAVVASVPCPVCEPPWSKPHVKPTCISTKAVLGLDLRVIMVASGHTVRHTGIVQNEMCRMCVFPLVNAGRTVLVCDVAEMKDKIN